MSRKRGKQIGGANARGDAFDRDHLDAAIASNQKNRGDSNPAFFFRIEQTPGADHFLLPIAQNWER